MWNWLKTAGLDLLKRLAAPAFSAAVEWLRGLIFGRKSDAKRIEAQKAIEEADVAAELRAKSEHEAIALARAEREKATRELLGREPTAEEVRDLIDKSKE